MNKINSFLGLVGKQDQIEKVPVNTITKNPFQPRRHFDRENLEELALSIGQYGVLQPIIVRKTGNREYQIIAGERRFRAAKLAGLTEIPVIVRDFSDHQVAEIAIIENLQREDLNYFEEADAFRQLLENFRLTQEEVAKRIGKSQSLIANKLRLLRLSPRVRNEISVAVLSERHVRALLKLSAEEEQLQALEKIYADNLNVKQTEQLVQQMLEKDAQDELVEDNTGSTKIGGMRDYKIFQNTLKKAMESIVFSGAKTEYREEIHEDHMEVTIRIYK